MSAIAEQLEVAQAEIARISQLERALIAYIDDAKIALGDDRVSGEPLADSIRRLREVVVR